MLPAGSHTYIDTYMPKAVGRYRTAAGEDICIISTSIIIRAVYKFHFTISMMAVSFFSNNLTPPLFTLSILKEIRKNAAEGYSPIITCTISLRSGDIKQLMNDI